MSNIGHFLEQIMLARYGKDVRQSIHDAIEEVDRVADTAQDSATASAASAAESAASITGVEERVKESENNAAASASSAATSEANALASEVSTATSERNVAEMEANAAASKQAAAESEANASASEQASKASEQAAATSEAKASASEQASKASEQAAAESETNALNYRDYAKSYALGTNGVVRLGDDTDNASYYYEQAKRIAQGLQGALMPMGTVTFAQLPAVAAQAGYMYNISDDFTTDDTFNEGAGHEYPAGTNVYLTADGKWDCMAGTAVGGVKGAKEATYRQGFVNLTPENIGALSEGGDSAENTVTFESGDAAEANVWTDVDVLSSGEKHKSILKKISTMFKNIRYLYKMLGNTDISDHGGTVTQAIVWLSNGTYELEREIAAQNDAFSSQISKLSTDLSSLNTDMSGLKGYKIFYFNGNATFNANGDYIATTAGSVSRAFVVAVPIYGSAPVTLTCSVTNSRLVIHGYNNVSPATGTLWINAFGLILPA